MPLSRKRRLPLVRESEATGRTLEVYQEIKSTLGVPHVNVIFQAYGAHPKFLDFMWKTLRPTLETQQFFSLADRLRGEAYTEIHNYFVVPDLCAAVREIQFSNGAQHELTDVVELFHYNNPLLLLIAAVLLQAFEEDSVHSGDAEAKPEHPVFAQKPVKIMEEAAPAPTRKVYEEMKRTLGVNFINTDYQCFARWPDFLNLYWNSLKSAVASPLYDQNKHSLRESAMSLASELENLPRLSVERMQQAGLPDEEISVVVRVTEEFLDLLSGLVLNIAFARIGLEGGNQNRNSRKDVKPEIMPQISRPDRPERAA